ncbi:hypothetical protein GDO78_002659 [Eleutherodactylus coqui]|uniref:Uncharacterized protein n=1 Tax=Eleutherodactylus coqui TaxID=57060 RepID=A0A8J6EWN1_ELECQ|nr:hypothetical protein GDO78_002659 [Eleutherodactylus coqui]
MLHKPCLKCQILGRFFFKPLLLTSIIRSPFVPVFDVLLSFCCKTIAMNTAIGYPQREGDYERMQLTIDFPGVSMGREMDTSQHKTKPFTHIYRA